MNISLKDLLAELGTMNGQANQSHSLKVGHKYIVRTVTYHYVGRLVAITASDLKFENASWVADSGRWNKALVEGNLSEVEPYPDGVIVSRAAIVDISVWQHDLPGSVK